MKITKKNLKVLIESFLIKENNNDLIDQFIDGSKPDFEISMI